jgi:hypothetical protein
MNYTQNLVTNNDEINVAIRALNSGGD